MSALTVLCQDHPFGGRSRLARSSRRSPRAAEAEVAREWFARYCEVVVVSLVRLYLDLGLCFEPHQQNTLLELRRRLARALRRPRQPGLLPPRGRARRPVRGDPRARRGERVDLPRGAGRRAARLLPVRQQRARRDRRARRRRLRRRGACCCGDLRGAARARARARRALPAHAARPPARRRALAVQGQPAHPPARHGRARRRHRRRSRST